MHRGQLRLLAVLLLTLALPPATHGSMFAQTGIDSNFLVVDGRVLFIQADETLTALDLQTGDVIARKTDELYWGHLSDSPVGILARANDDKFDDKFMVLSTSDYSTIWSAAPASGPVVDGEYVLAGDGYGRVTCRTLRDGRELWTYDLPGAVERMVKKGKVLLHREGTYSDAEPRLVLLDQKTGEVLLETGPPRGVHYLTSHFDGERIYLPTGRLEGKRSDVKFERLVVLDLAGREVSSRSVPSSLTERYPPGEQFTFDGLTFDRGEVRPAESESDDHLAHGERGTYRLASGALTVHAAEAKATEIEFAAATGGWRGRLPYLRDRGGRVAQVAEAEGKLLLGTSLGQVECINIATGRSLWLYIFPAMDCLLSFSFPYGQPPYYAWQARSFHELNRDRVAAGMVLLERDGERLSAEPTAKTATRIVHDPEPFNPFSEYTKLFVLSWGGALGPLALLVLTIVRFRRRRGAPRNVALVGVGMAAVVTGYMFMCGRFSLSSTIALKVSAITVFLLTLWAIIGLYRRRKWLWATIALLFLGLLVWWSAPVIRYA